MDTDLTYFVAIQLPGSPDDSVWAELDRRMELHGYSTSINDGCLELGTVKIPYSIALPRGMYMSYEVGPDDEGAVFTFEEAESIALECWPHQPIVFALGTTEFFGHTKGDFEEAEVELRRVAGARFQ